MRVWVPKPSSTTQRSTEKATRGEEIAAASAYAAVIKIKLLVMVGTRRCQEEKTLKRINITRPLVWCSSSPWRVGRVVLGYVTNVDALHLAPTDQIDGHCGVQGFRQSNMFFHTRSRIPAAKCGACSVPVPPHISNWCRIASNGKTLLPVSLCHSWFPSHHCISATIFQFFSVISFSPFWHRWFRNAYLFKQLPM